jgi:hypothetical protein
MDPGFEVHSKDSPEPDSPAFKKNQKLPYRELIGCLLWLARSTRPDIALAVAILARYSTKPAIRHWHALLHVLKYLEGTAEFGITFERSAVDTEFLRIYSDADYATCQDTRKSMSGMIALYNGAPIAWHAANAQTSSRTKHVHVSYHFTRDAKEKGLVDVQHVEGGQNPAHLLASKAVKSFDEFTNARNIILNQLSA